jgi:hypothetical protein
MTEEAASAHLSAFPNKFTSSQDEPAANDRKITNSQGDKPLRAI